MRAADAIGKTSLEVLPSGLGERFTARDQMVVSTRSPVIIESEEALPIGIRTFINRAFPVLDQRGEVIAIVSTETDITALRQAERKLRDSEQRFRAIFETAAVGIALCRADDGRIVSCNPTYAKILGYEPDELIGVSFVELTHEEDRGRNIELFMRQATGAIGAFDIEKRYVAKDGRVVWVRVSASLLANERGEPQYSIGVMTDLTERQTVEDRLRQSEQQLRLITNSLPVTIAYCDAQQRYRFVNQWYCEWSGRRPEELIGVTVEDA